MPAGSPKSQSPVSPSTPEKVVLSLSTSSVVAAIAVTGGGGGELNHNFSKLLLGKLHHKEMMKPSSISDKALPVTSVANKPLSVSNAEQFNLPFISLEQHQGDEISSSSSNKNKPIYSYQQQRVLAMTQLCFSSLPPPTIVPISDPYLPKRPIPNSYLNPISSSSTKAVESLPSTRHHIWSNILTPIPELENEDCYPSILPK